MSVSQSVLCDENEVRDKKSLSNVNDVVNDGASLDQKNLVSTSPSRKMSTAGMLQSEKLR